MGEVTVRPGDIPKIKELLSRMIMEAYDIKVERLRVTELEERENVLTLKGEWEGSIERGKYEARILNESVIFLRIEVIP